MSAPRTRRAAPRDRRADPPRRADVAAARSSRERVDWRWLVLVFALAIAPFLPALRGEFLTYDDDAYVSANRMVLQGLSPASIGYAFTTFNQGNYHPLTWLSLMLDAQVYGANPSGFHATSLLLHGVNACILLMIVLCTGATPLVAILATLLWALHPTRTESVAWISERKDVLSLTFGLLALLAYLRRTPVAPPADATAGAAQSARDRRVAVGWTALWMVLSLLSKAMLVTLPALLLLLDFWPLCRLRDLRSARAAIVEKWPLWLLSASFSALAVVSQSSQSAMMGLERMPASHRLPNALMSYGRYLGTTLWPVDLAAFYPFPVDGWPLWQWLGVTALLIAISAAVFALRERLPSLLVGWGWYVVALLPVSGVLQTGGQALADRFTYLPTIGFVLAGVGALPRAPERRRVAGAIAAAACLVLALLAWHQAGYWRDTIALMEHTVDVTTFNVYAQSSLALAHMTRGENDTARAMYEEVLRAQPNIAQVHLNLGVIAASKGDYERAIGHYQDGIRINGGSFEAYNNLAAALLELQRPKPAAEALQQALRFRPDDPDALFNLGMAYSQSGDLGPAAEAYQKVVALTPNDAEAHYRLGVLRLHLGDRTAAERELRAALALDPHHAAASSTLRELAISPGATAAGSGLPQ